MNSSDVSNLVADFGPVGQVSGDIDSRIAAAQWYLVSLLAQRERIEAFGNDADYEPDSVIVFKRRWSRTPRDYTYAAVKIDADCWYVTGQETQRFTFARLVEQHLTEAHTSWVSTSWQPLAPAR